MQMAALKKQLHVINPAKQRKERLEVSYSNESSSSISKPGLVLNLADFLPWPPFRIPISALSPLGTSPQDKISSTHNFLLREDSRARHR